jgi:hypothetical protein
MTYNRSKILKKIASKEKEIDLNLINQSPSEVIAPLRDSLEQLNTKIAQSMDLGQNKIPNDPKALETQINTLLGEEYTNISDDHGSGVYEVVIGEDRIELNPKKNYDIDKDVPSMNQETGQVKNEGLNINSFISRCFQYLEQFMLQNNDELTKNKLIDQINPLLKRYYESLIPQEVEELDKSREGGVRKVKWLTFTNDSKKKIEEIFTILQENNMAGFSFEDSFEDLEQPNDNIGDTTMASKKFNLKKHAAKVYDTLREREIMETDLQYLTRHPKTIQEFEEVYIGDYIWRNSVMDKYYPETVDPKTGEYVGGYINDRFQTHVNTEGNSMRARPDGTYPDRPDSYSTERRLEEMRDDHKRDYEPSEGSKTEQQNKIVASSDFNFTKDAGLNKVCFAGKVIYFDTDDDLETFRKLAQLNMEVPVAEPQVQVPQKKNEIADEIVGETNLFEASLGDLNRFNSVAELNDAIIQMNTSLTDSNIDASTRDRWKNDIITKFNSIKNPTNQIPNHTAPEEPHYTAPQEEINETGMKLGL